jgi:hypothetical protein
VAAVGSAGDDRVLAPNRELAGADTVVSCEGPEDVTVDDGRLYTGTEENRIVRTVEPVGPDTTNADLERVATVDGPPLGMTFDGDELLVCATDAGLESVSPNGTVTTLSAGAGGRSIAFADDLNVADDGCSNFATPVGCSPTTTTPTTRPSCWRVSGSPTASVRTPTAIRC